MACQIEDNTYRKIFYFISIIENRIFNVKKGNTVSDSLISMYVLISMGIFFMLAVGVVIFTNRSQLKVNKILLQEKEKEIKHQNELLQNIVKTQEEERRRIAAELHDDIASKLNIIHLNVHFLKKVNYLKDTELNLVSQIESSLNHSIERTRTISHELLPQVFKKFGINHALDELEHSVNQSRTVLLNIESSSLIKITNEFKLLHIYRIIQELLQNTLKYAKANNINIDFKEEEAGMISLRYKDDGVGFDTKKEVLGLGVSNILTRAKLLEGQVEFKSIPDIQGMSFTLKFKNND